MNYSMYEIFTLSNNPPFLQPVVDIKSKQRIIFLFITDAMEYASKKFHITNNWSLIRPYTYVNNYYPIYHICVSHILKN